MSALTLFQALDLFILDKQAAGYSANTLRNYRNTINKLHLYFATALALADLGRAQWIGFFAWLQDEYISVPGGVAPRGEIHLSQKTICNIHTDISAFYTWAVKHGHAPTHILRSVERPRFEKPVITPLTQEEVKRLLRACQGEAQTEDEHDRARATAVRDRALILTLLSTGARVSEICAANVGDYDVVERCIKVAGKGRGRDSKERLVYVGNRAARALDRYLSDRGANRATDPLFCVMPEQERRPFSRDVLGRLLRRLGDRAHVAHVHAHRFCHTFAVNYLRNGGDVLTLQTLLGHESLEMVRHYAHLASQDCARVHRNADPVDNWRL